MLPVSSIPEARMKEAGKSLNALVSGLDQGEEILNIITKNDFAKGLMYFATRGGLVKATQMEEFDVKKSKIMACGLKDGDELIYAKPSEAEQDNICLLYTSRCV